MDTPVLQSDRLTLRPVRESDADRLQMLAGERQVAATTLNIPHPYPLAAAVAFINQMQEQAAAGIAYTFGLVLKTEDALIGCIGLRVAQAFSRAEIGYWVGVPYWGQGYMSEAARRVLAFAFDDLGLHRVYASHFASNPASGRVMQKIGMQYEATLRDHVAKWDTYHDLVYYGILRDEYEANGAGS